MTMWREQCCSKYFACGAVPTALFICTFYVFLTPPNQVWLAPPIARLTPEFDNVQSKCSVILEKNGSDIPRENRVCSLRNFQVAMDTNGYFPDHGRWQLPNNGFPQLSYIPDYCYFDRDTPLSISKCFSERRWRRILTMGDSIGKRHSIALVSTLQVYGYECKLMRAERFQPLVADGYPPDVNYFLKIFPDIRLKTKPRSCRTCGGRLTRCINGNSTVEIEHLGLAHLEDRSLQLPPAYTTTLQFYFKKYLKNNYPDLLIIGPPFIHEREQPLSKSKMQLKGLIDSLTELVPASTDTIWIPQSTTWRTDVENINSKMVALNHAMFDRLGKRFVSEWDNWNGFHDEHALTCPIENMRLDSVHMEPGYYDVIMQHLFAMYCLQ
ncbi:hypothetical protein CAPTEDRAFT_199025 [Capitella teleta]|uniref:Uncharacterized protein n=1 Tax=Capitella teleta TaxID=283909 RepID=R7TQQ2_CAPTE|nr:hypothetical protein CAPTEDRAFT_199025 [Capitella teleta]|eukprot:ELT95994.1 hypothetical protein CAPTEDRAFT_199025 [Capitella teleta]